MEKQSRRDALTAIAGAAVGTPAAAQNPARQQKPPEHKHEGLVNVKAPPVYKARFFTAQELEALAVLVDLIIPRTDTPGARDARVHEIIDSGVRPGARAAWREGMTWLAGQAGNRTFVELPRGEQVSILERASREKNTPGARLFKLLKDATIDGYYSTREGLAIELGWNFNTFLPEFRGCTHPEHQG